MRLVICVECDTALICNDTEGIRECNCRGLKLLTEYGRHYYAGDNTVPICIVDESLVKAVRETEDTKSKTNIFAFVCSELDTKIAKIDKI